MKHKRLIAGKLLVAGEILLAVIAFLVLAGCAPTDRTASARHGDVSGMTCPRCEAVWVAPQAAGGGGPRVQAVHWGREMVCPDCDAMASAYVKDGEKVLHDCPTCNVSAPPASPFNPTHPKGTHS